MRTMLPPVFALLDAAALADSSAEPRFSLVPSPSAAKATGAVRSQPKTAAGRMAWRVRIFTEEVEVSPDQAQGSYRQVGSGPEVEF